MSNPGYQDKIFLVTGTANRKHPITGLLIVKKPHAAAKQFVSMSVVTEGNILHVTGVSDAGKFPFFLLVFPPSAPGSSKMGDYTGTEFTRLCKDVGV